MCYISNKNLSPRRSSKGHSESPSMGLGEYPMPMLAGCLTAWSWQGRPENRPDAWVRETKGKGTVHEACCSKPEVSVNHKVGREMLSLP